MKETNENEKNNSLTNEEENIYSRQIKLDDIGIEGQKKLKKSKVIIIGAGGLGSSCIMHLAGAGIGTICIVDNDLVDKTNLHRQLIHNKNNLGKNKAISAKEFINNLNPNIEVIAINDCFSQKNALNLCKDFDLIIDCCDNPITRYLINDVSVLLNKPLISGSAIRWEGQLAIYIKNCLGEKLPCYRCLNPIAPQKFFTRKCNEVGVISTSVGIIGTLQANEAIKFILNLNDKILQKQIIIFDALDLKFKVVKTRNYKDDCIICGKNPQITIDNFNNYDYEKFVNTQ